MPQQDDMHRTAWNQIRDLTRRPMGRSGMFCSVRLLIVLAIALAVGFAGGPRVHAMGVAGDAVAMVICSEDGAQTIYVSADGTPVPRGSDCAKCPLCIALSVPGLIGSEASGHARLSRRYRGVRPATIALRTPRYMRRQSRGPPSDKPQRLDPAQAAPVCMHLSVAGTGFIEAGSTDLGPRRTCGQHFKDARQ
ncbi:hypothetical protein QKW60_16475 [Defluviimonas aestuarii]|uniref:DUF2946 family protein n=1 Tax=Albidovulum aestuarii TaxID=1130726 RepID=UPI002499DDC6|nr:DUF2946 family protein [Defluviimonas aestuarii]MDI3338005.1 hypothetical protein [Defluviimonas aestuarii]